MKKREFLKTVTICAANLGGAAGVWVGSAHAKSPETTTLLVGFAAGGGLDILTRQLADDLRTMWARSVIVLNKPGAAGQLAVQDLKKAAPDGSILMTAPFAVPVMNPEIYNLKDQTSGVDYLPVAQLASFEFAFVVPGNHPAADLPSFIAWVKQDPTRANFGTAAIGNLPHFLGLNLGTSIGVPMTAVGYKGFGSLIPDLIGGQIPCAISAENDFAELRKSGRIRVLATFGDKRSASSTTVPTAKELGIDLVATGWYAVYAPPKTPAALVEQLAQDISSVLSNQRMSEKMKQMGLVPTPGIGPKKLAEITASAIASSGPLIKGSGIK